jgi:hypothetical protein
VAKKLMDPEFSQPPPSRQHFDVWQFQKPDAAGLNQAAKALGVSKTTIQRRPGRKATWTERDHCARMRVFVDASGLRNGS